MTESEILELFKHGDFPEVTPENEQILQSAMVRILLKMKDKADDEGKYTVSLENLMRELKEELKSTIH